MSREYGNATFLAFEKGGRLIDEVNLASRISPSLFKGLPLAVRAIGQILDTERTSGRYTLGHIVWPREGGCYHDVYRPYSPCLIDIAKGDFEVNEMFFRMKTFQMGVSPHLPRNGI